MIWIVIGSVFVVTTVAWLIVGLRKRIRDASATIIRVGPTRTSPANCFGVESAGRAQIRGNGMLAIAGGDLRFEQYVPRKSVTISLRSVTEVATARSFLGKRTLHDLVVVRWAAADGREDRAAWVVKDVPGWVEAIGNA